MLTQTTKPAQDAQTREAIQFINENYPAYLSSTWTPGSLALLTSPDSEFHFVSTDLPILKKQLAYITQTLKRDQIAKAIQFVENHHMEAYPDPQDPQGRLIVLIHAVCRETADRPRHVITELHSVRPVASELRDVLGY